MEFRAPIVVCCALLCASACKLTEPLAEPTIPEDFPQIDDILGGRAELVVDGEMVTTKEDGGTYYDPGGLDPDELPASVSFDYVLSLEFLAPDVGTYDAADGELEASWSDGVDFEVGTECGAGRLVVVGDEELGDILDRRAIWGTLQLELCEYDYDGPKAGRMAISGRFSSIVTEL